MVCCVSAYNFSHRIDHLSFGEEIPGLINPLDGTEKITADGAYVYILYKQELTGTSAKAHIQDLPITTLWPRHSKTTIFTERPIQRAESNIVHKPEYKVNFKVMDGVYYMYIKVIKNQPVMTCYMLIFSLH